jgi:hypothetical protein
MKNKIKGGKADNLSATSIAKKFGVPVSKIEKELKTGKKIEMEHTNDSSKAEEIALDHLSEIPDYYTRLNKMEKEGDKKWKLNENITYTKQLLRERLMTKADDDLLEISDFVNFAKEYLGITDDIKVLLAFERTPDLQTTAYYDLSGIIKVYVKDRACIDIIRSLGHELTHHKQNLDGRLTNVEKDGSDGSEIENEANAVAGKLIRLWGKQRPEIYESLKRKSIIKENTELFFESEKDKRIKLSIYDEDKKLGTIVLARPLNLNDNETLEIIDIYFNKGTIPMLVCKEVIVEVFKLFPDTYKLSIHPPQESVDFWMKMGAHQVMNGHLMLMRGH